MSYDIINDDTTSTSYDPIIFFTISDLLECLTDHPDLPVKFINTDYSPTNLISWRGAYDLPCIAYDDNGCEETASEIAKRIRLQLLEPHYGYKGGEYTYSENEEFYVSSYGLAHYYKVVGSKVEDDTLILLTKKDPY